MLLAGSQRQRKSAPPLGIGGLTSEPPRHLAHILFARGNYAGKRSTVTRRQTEALRFHRDNVRLRGWTEQPQRDALGNRHDKHRANRVRRFRQWRVRFDGSKKIRGLRNNRGYVVFQRSLQRFHINGPARGKRNLLNAQSGILRVGLQHFAIFRMHRARHQHAPSLR